MQEAVWGQYRIPNTERPGGLSTEQSLYRSANIGRPVDISQDNVRCDGIWGCCQIQHDIQQVGNQWGVYLQANKPRSVVQPSCHVNGLRRWGQNFIDGYKTKGATVHLHAWHCRRKFVYLYIYLFAI